MVPIFNVLAELGVVLLMFVAGLETDIAMMRSAVAPAFWAATGGVILPMVDGCYFAHFVGCTSQESIFIGTILTATSVIITAQTLINLNQIKSRAGSTILGAAVIDDVLGLIVLSLVIALGPQLGHSGGTSWKALAITLGRMALSLVAMLWLGPCISAYFSNPNTATPFCVPTNTLPFAIIGVMNLLPGPKLSRGSA